MTINIKVHTYTGNEILENKAWLFENSSAISLGQDIRNTIVFKDELGRISNLHARVTYEVDKWVWTNYSDSSTLINNKIIAKGTSEVLTKGALVHIGPYVLDIDINSLNPIELGINNSIVTDLNLTPPVLKMVSINVTEKSKSILKSPTQTTEISIASPVQNVSLNQDMDRLGLGFSNGGINPQPPVNTATQHVSPQFQSVKFGATQKPFEAPREVEKKVIPSIVLKPVSMVIPDGVDLLKPVKSDELIQKIYKPKIISNQLNNDKKEFNNHSVNLTDSEINLTSEIKNKEHMSSNESKINSSIYKAHAVELRKLLVEIMGQLSPYGIEQIVRAEIASGNTGQLGILCWQSLHARHASISQQVLQQLAHWPDELSDTPSQSALKTPQL